MSTILQETGVQVYNLKHVKGDTFLRTMRFVDSDQNPIDITGWTVFFTAKDVATEADAAAEVTKTVTAHTNAALGQTQILIAASDMAILAGEYFYDIQIKKADGTIYTILRGLLIIDQQFTVRTS